MAGVTMATNWASRTRRCTSELHQVAARALVHQGRVGGAQAQLGAVGAGVEHVDEKVGGRVERGFGQLQDAAGQRVELGLQIGRPVFEELVDVAELAFHRPHAVDGALDDAGRDAALQQHEAAADARNGGLGRVGHDVVRADEQVLALHAEGAGALHARELGAGLERDAGRVAAQHEHHLTAGAGRPSARRRWRQSSGRPPGC
jgi:hypothetical protein